MTKQARKGAARLAPAEIGVQMERAMAAGGVTMDIMAKAYEAYVNGLVAMNDEAMDFVNTRLRHDAELGESLAKSQSWAEALKAQQAWIREATQDYVNEAQKMARIANRVNREGWAPLQKQASKALHDFGA